MPHESKRWSPSRWTHAKVLRFLGHVFMHASFDLEDTLGPYAKGLAMLELRGKVYGDLSGDALRSSGVRTLGE